MSLLQTGFEHHPSSNATLSVVQSRAGTGDQRIPQLPSRYGKLERFATGLVLLAFCVMLTAIAVHEFRVWNPELTDSYFPGWLDGNVRIPGFSQSEVLSLSVLLVPFDFHAQVSSVIPTSYDLAKSVGWGAAASGWLISCVFIGALMGSMAAKKFLKEEDGYCQRRARKGLLLGVAISNVGLVLYAGALHQLQGKILLLTLMCIRVLIGFGYMFAFIIGPIMAYRAIPASKKTMFSMAITITKNVGLIVGPSVSALALQTRRFVLSSEEEHNIVHWTPQEKALWPAVASVLLGLGFNMFLLLASPVELPIVEESLCPSGTPRSEDIQLHRPDQMSDIRRRQMFFTTIGYQIERALVVSAIEVSTLMLLEVEFKMRTIDACYIFSSVSTASVIIIVFFMMLLRKRLISEVSLFLVPTAISAGGAFLFFDFGGLSTLLIADFVIYGFSGAALGISEGWGTLAAKEKTDFTQARWRMLSAVNTCVMRMLAPPLARMLIEYGGRNTYAGAQLLVVAAGLCTAQRACRLLWDHMAEASPRPQETREVRSLDGTQEIIRAASAPRERACPEAAKQHVPERSISASGTRPGGSKPLEQ